MKTSTLALVLAFGAIGTAHAQNADMQNGVPLSSQPAQVQPQTLPQPMPQGALPQQPTPAPRYVVKKTHFVVSMGFTLGGDELATTEFTDGTSETVHSGGLVAFSGGVEHRINQQFSVQGNVGFHVDNSTAENGDVHFRRYPIELIGYYHVAPKWRIGGGVRHVTNVRLKSSGVIGGMDVQFDNATGALFEVEHMFPPPGRPEGARRARKIHDQWHES